MSKYSLTICVGGKGFDSLLSVKVWSNVLLFADCLQVKFSYECDIFYVRMKSFPTQILQQVQVGHANEPSWQTEICLVWNRQHIAVPFTIDGIPFMPAKFCRNVADVKLLYFFCIFQCNFNVLKVKLLDFPSNQLQCLIFLLIILRTRWKYLVYRWPE